LEPASSTLTLRCAALSLRRGTPSRRRAALPATESAAAGGSSATTVGTAAAADATSAACLGNGHEDPLVINILAVVQTKRFERALAGDADHAARRIAAKAQSRLL
jgi:hypothetical protein